MVSVSTFFVLIKNRVRVQEPSRHTPIQNSLEYLPRGLASDKIAQTGNSKELARKKIDNSYI